MRAAKVLALAVVCVSAAICGALFQALGASLRIPDFIGAAQAESGTQSSGQSDQGGDALPIPSAPDPTRPNAAKSAPLPSFVAQPHVLSGAGMGEDPEGTSPPDSAAEPPTDSSATGSVSDPTTDSVSQDTSKEAGASSKPRAVSIKVEPIPGTEPPKKAIWPTFIGAKSLFGVAKKPASMEARSIGSYSRGCLAGAVALPINGPAWQEMRLSRNRNWGNPKLIALIEQFAKDAQKLDGWPGLLVGDIAQPRGGPMITGHASHQIGLDADFWLTPMPNRRLTRKERETMEATSMLDDSGVKVNRKVFTSKQVALIKRAASYPQVERIFVHPAIKKALCEVAGTDRAWLGKVRPWFGHYYHFHMRIKCPDGVIGCTPQVAPTGDDGCGKEVDKWLSKVIPAKGPPVPRPAGPPGPPKAPRPPIMLSDLPQECQAVLASGPDAIKIPRAALMTRLQVKKALAKAAAVNMALYKASAVAGGKAARGTLANSPALRPHLHKSATADPK
jgi:penicillin-insensitive murein endopeptidase